MFFVKMRLSAGIYNFNVREVWILAKAAQKAPMPGGGKNGTQCPSHFDGLSPPSRACGRRFSSGGKDGFFYRVVHNFRSMQPAPTAAAGFTKMGIERAQFHLFLCIGPDCCGTAEAEKVWNLLKELLKKHNLPALRTKAACLRICTGGPWLVVYPEGIWYGAVTRERCERIVQEHLVLGHPVQEWIAQTHCLGAPCVLPGQAQG